MDREPLGVLPGEFERQEAILLAWPREGRPPLAGGANELSVREDQLYCEMVRAIAGSIQVVILVEDSRSEGRARRLLLQAEVPVDALRFVQVPFHSEWIRDYGPMGVRRSDGSPTLIDAEYVDGFFVGIYPHDDRVPSRLGAFLELPVVRAPIAIQHGNLLSNGRGLLITTRKLLEDNAGRGYDAEDVTRILKGFYGAKQVVFLEVLEDEPTGHVDMFATFPWADTAVVGQCSPEFDPANAAILDRNAKRLASLGAPCGPLKVARIPMPRSPYGSVLWPSYTNVVYANDVLLVPVYPGLDPEGESEALAVYRRLLPERTIVGIDSLPLLQLCSGIHCITLNLESAGNVLRAAAEAPPQSQASMD